jgi:primase-polymerase (primpol)-like protein
MFPTEIRKRDRWVCYKLDNKCPVSPVNGMYNVDITKSENLTDYKTACLTQESHDNLGLGFVLGDGVIGIDFDHCVVDGVIDNTVMGFIKELNSYTELSHSGSGIHVLLNGKLAKEGNRGSITNEIKIEMYDKGRYFTMSGNTLRGFTSMRSSKDVVDRLHETYCKKETVAPTPKITKLCEDTEKQLLKAKEDQVFLSYKRLYFGLAEITRLVWKYFLTLLIMNQSQISTRKSASAPTIFQERLSMPTADKVRVTTTNRRYV